jgi:phage baseplate assembly protein W
MLTAKLYSVSQNSNQNSNLAVVGVVIAENDATLPFQRIAGTVSWGDGTDPYVVSPTAGVVQASSIPTIIRAGAKSTLNLTPAPYTGTFNLTYNLATSIASLNFDITAANLQDAIKAALSPGETVLVEGESPTWTFIFDSSATADKITVGANTLFAPVSLPVHTYPDGNFSVTLTAHNFRSPTPDVVETSLELIFTRNANLQSQNPIILGPILAADAGFPNSEQWNFNLSVDTQVLISNIKMILIVEPGERLMMPDYGCALQQFLFNDVLDSTDQDIETEIRRAIATWEPRVDVNQVTFTNNPNGRTINVTVSGVSKLDQERFQLNVELER